VRKGLARTSHSSGVAWAEGEEDARNSFLFAYHHLLLPRVFIREAPFDTAVICIQKLAVDHRAATFLPSFLPSWRAVYRAFSLSLSLSLSLSQKFWLNHRSRSIYLSANYCWAIFKNYSKTLLEPRLSLTARDDKSFQQFVSKHLRMMRGSCR